MENDEMLLGMSTDLFATVISAKRNAHDALYAKKRADKLVSAVIRMGPYESALFIFYICCHIECFSDQLTEEDNKNKAVIKDIASFMSSAAMGKCFKSGKELRDEGK